MLSETLYKTDRMPEKLKIQYRAFLSRSGLRDEEDSDYTILVLDDEADTIAACGSLKHNILKQIAVSGETEGEGLCARIVSMLTELAVNIGETHLFVYTKPKYGKMFESLGFSLVVNTRDILMMENKRGGIDTFLSSLPKSDGRIGALVMNANPFTKGHRHLAEYASEHCDFVYLFILSEDLSMFPAETRLELAKKATADLANVHVVGSRDYLISRATFPTYFIKEKADIDSVQCELDILLFAARIAPALHISVRFAGEEPFEAVTAHYNERMRELLPDFGIEFTEIPRYCNISASHVRRLLTEGRLEEAREHLPDTTYEYCLHHFGTGSQIQR